MADQNPVTTWPATSLKNCNASKAADRARIMLGCYRKAEAGDPEIYTTAVIAVLMRYPDSVVMAVTEPATGLPSKLKWLPAIAEIREACDEAMEPILRERQRRRDLEAQRQLRLAGPTEPRPTLEEIEAKLGRKLGFKRIPAAPVERNDGGHASRALADIAARKWRRELPCDCEPNP